MLIPGHKREALLRLKTVRGHIDGVIGMVEDEVYCPDLMKQVAALQASLEKVNRVLLRNHLETCVSEAIRTGQGQEKITELMEALPYNSGLTDFRHQARALALEVTAMTCASCVRRVERALEAVPGVAAATVNLAAESADVTLAQPVDPGVLITAVERAG